MLRQIPGRTLATLNCFALLIIFALAAKEFLVPILAEHIYGAQYKELVFRCDDVMRNHFIAKNRVLIEPSEENIKSLHAAEVGLIECHNYDLLRKRLISLGVTDNELARLGLEEIEERGADVREFVKIHEIKY